LKTNLQNYILVQSSLSLSYRIQRLGKTRHKNPFASIEKKESYSNEDKMTVENLTL